MFHFRSLKIILAGMLSIGTTASAVTTQDADLATQSFNTAYWNSVSAGFQVSPDLLDEFHPVFIPLGIPDPGDPAQGA